MYNASMSTRKQGDIGLSHCIYELSKKGYTISIPLTDNSLYDLVVEKDNELNTVQVKSTRYKRGGVFRVGLKRVRHNTSETKIYNFDNTEVDYVFISVVNGDSYFIPSKNILVKTEMTLDSKYNDFKLGRCRSSVDNEF